jgi:hypothetical protein
MVTSTGGLGNMCYEQPAVRVRQRPLQQMTTNNFLADMWQSEDIIELCHGVVFAGIQQVCSAKTILTG